MTHRGTAGFTLMELLIALALTAIVAVGALAALNTFADADQLASQRMEETVGIGRALQMVRRDVSEATALDVTATEWVITRRDGTGVAYAVAVGGTELHRFQ
ncbi:MAG: prepilin-type N-terminal cleavage/methylation domain-containing protein, partial [Planctomycetes bacterium]|nr:prepilin-type N-terminal cleavage/methylation domain-containing protein [Planctomycetota bacterium]